jgi:uncharacterized membrane protein YphA (DoxX/SURF4 family)
MNFMVFSRWLIGLLLVVSGFEKAVLPYQNFAYVIQAYEFFPPHLEIFAARMVPWVELIAGVFLIAGLWLKPVILLCRGLFLVFIVLIFQALVRRLPLDDCGCFGQLISLPPFATLVMDIVISVILLVMARKNTLTARLSLDRYFEK